MIPLNNFKNDYPSFQPNQVLTSQQLNSLADYLEQQGRLTRQTCIGIGIVCGFEVNLLQNGEEISVSISSGVGITSQGYLIRVPETTCKYYRLYQDAAGYPPFINGQEKQYELLELLEDKDARGAKVITAKKVSNKVVLLYLEIRERETDKCLDDSCDEKGRRWEFMIRKLLVDRSDMESIVKGLHQIEKGSLDDYFNPEYHLPSVCMQRFGMIKGESVLPYVKNLERFYNCYFTVIKHNASELFAALERMHGLFRPLFDLQLQSAGANPFERMEEALCGAVEAQPLLAQYAYDLLLDIKSTYDELSGKLFEWTARCCPSPEIFPRHLMLGELKPNHVGGFDPGRYDLPDVYRHHFVPAPIHDHQSDLLLNIKQLIHRLTIMTEHCERMAKGDLLELEEIRITPSKDCSAPLGKQAIPFYYDVVDGGFYKYWDFEAARQNRANQILGYHAELYKGNAAPLLCDICKYPKFRIEGHVGKQLKPAIDTLKELRQANNLPFDIITLKLDPTFDDVYLADDSKIADIQAAYLVHRNEAVCCIREFIAFLENVKDTIPLIILFLLYISLFGARAGQMPVMYEFLQNIFNQFYQLYIDALSDLEQELPKDIKEFDINEFGEAYNLAYSMTTLIKYFINTWGDVESMFISTSETATGASSAGNADNTATATISEPSNFRVYVPPASGLVVGRHAASDLLSIILNYFELFLDRLGDDCLLSRFVTLHDLFVDRVEKHTIFSRFNGVCHGMEHIAGTSKCGTFILVYADSLERRDVSGRVVDGRGKGIENIIVTEAQRPYRVLGKTGADGKYSVMVKESAARLKFKRYGYYVQYTELKTANNKLNVSTDVWKRFRASGEVPPEGDTSNIPESARMTLARENRYMAYDAVNAELSKAGMTVAQPLAPGGSTRLPTDRRVIDFDENENYIVVGDFYLPCKIPDYHFEIPLKDACSKRPDGSLIDIGAVMEALTMQIMGDVTFIARIEEAGMSEAATMTVNEAAKRRYLDILPKVRKPQEPESGLLKEREEILKAREAYLDSNKEVVQAEKGLINMNKKKLDAVRGMADTYAAAVAAKEEYKEVVRQAGGGTLTPEQEIALDEEVLNSKKKLIDSRKKIIAIEESFDISASRRARLIEELKDDTEVLIQEQEVLIEKAGTADVTAEKMIAMKASLVSNRESLVDTVEKYGESKISLGISKENYQAVTTEKMVPALEKLKLAKTELLELKTAVDASALELKSLESDISLIDKRIVDLKGNIG